MDNFWMNWQQIFLGFLLGILAGLIAGFPFFYFSARSLRQEAEKLRNLVNIIGRALESRGYADFNWDEKGNMKGVRRFLTCIASVGSSTSSPELTDKKTPNGGR
jgi:hypothetical protein